MSGVNTKLRGKKNFALFARARQYRGSLLRAACVHSEGLKVAVVVGKKVSHKAVDRNKLKRQLRELYRKYMQRLPQDLWLMIIAMPEALNADFTSLEADLEALFKQIAAKQTGNRRH